MILVCRHGETLANVEHRFQGWTDTELTARGVEQSIELGRTLAQYLPAHVYLSDAPRVRTTASLAALLSQPVIISPELRERNCGDLEGTPIQGQYITDPALVCPNGESRDTARARVEAYLKTIKIDAGTYIFLTHANTSRVIYEFYSGEVAPLEWGNAEVKIVKR